MLSLGEKVGERAVAGLTAQICLLDFSKFGLGGGIQRLLIGNAARVSLLAAEKMMVERSFRAEVTAIVEALEASDVRLSALMVAESLRIGKCDRALVVEAVAVLSAVRACVRAVGSRRLRRRMSIVSCSP